MEVVSRNEVNAFVTKDSSVVREILAPRNSAIQRQSFAEATIAPGASTLAHYHPTTEELYYILRGQGKMAIEVEEREVREGDAIPILPGQRHQIRNTGAEDLVLLCCCVPAYEDSDTVMCASLL